MADLPMVEVAFSPTYGMPHFRWHVWESSRFELVSAKQRKPPPSIPPGSRGRIPT
jgi:hypothetical protein